MSEIAFSPSVSQSLAEEKAREAAQAGGISKGASKENVMALAYYYLVQAATTTSESALVQAKQTKANANAQQQLNREAAQLQWYTVPNLKTTHHHKYITHTHWTANPFKHGGFHYSTRQKVTWETHKNQLTVINDQAKNEQVAAERQFLTQKMGVLQQLASIGETHINTVNDEASQSMQESSQILKIIQNLTFHALLRPKPQS